MYPRFCKENHSEISVPNRNVLQVNHCNYCFLCSLATPIDSGDFNVRTGGALAILSQQSGSFSRTDSSDLLGPEHELLLSVFGLEVPQHFEEK